MSDVDIALTKHDFKALCAERRRSHCHKSGALRALLCNRCNTAIGNFDESPEIIRKAAEYVERFNHNLDTSL